MKRFLLLALLPFAAQAEDGLLVSDTMQEAAGRHQLERYQEQQAMPMGNAPLGGYQDERFGDTAPAITPQPGYAVMPGFEPVDMPQQPSIPYGR